MLRPFAKCPKLFTVVEQPTCSGCLLQNRTTTNENNHHHCHQHVHDQVQPSTMSNPHPHTDTPKLLVCEKICSVDLISIESNFPSFIWMSLVFIYILHTSPFEEDFFLDFHLVRFGRTAVVRSGIC